MDRILFWLTDEFVCMLLKIVRGSSMFKLTEKFSSTIKAIHKENGERWLAELDQLIKECEARWQMNMMEPFDLSYNYVAPATLKEGTDIVVKLAIPSKEFLEEIEALKLFNGNGMVNVLDVDEKKGILLIERLIPGNTLATLEDDEKATRIAAQIMRRLWRPALDNTQISTIDTREESLEKIYEGNPDGIGPITKEMLREAIGIFKRLQNEKSKRYLLHGDLHHYNILKSGDGSWTAIDPKGLIGDREYDVIQFLLNMLRDDLHPLIENRINILVEELNLDKQKILLWGFAHSVLANSWSLEDDNFNPLFFKGIQVFKDIHHSQYGPF